MFTSSADISFSQLFRTFSFNIIVKKIFVTSFSFLIRDSLKPIYSLQQPKPAKYDEFFLLILAKCLARIN